MPAAWAGHPIRLLVTRVLFDCRDSSQLRLFFEGYNPDHHLSLPPSPRRGYDAAWRLFLGVFSNNWYQSHGFRLSGFGIRLQSSDLRIFLLFVSSACCRFSVYCLSACRQLYLVYYLDLQKENKSHGENLLVRGRIDRRETPRHRFKSRSNSRKKSKVKCFYCGKEGHMKNKCF
ncbi:hypothetical protein M9H77_17040 [Catharanthus roseus]|uniref:Uncharacterized protein n=1 Tax=Catharanthus roseus TaxID=4058 RepID=A0ACC0B3H2_CATRO|nr:hypothetical protein M9H77_17040 [Catharanthus roseus]